MQEQSKLENDEHIALPSAWSVDAQTPFKSDSKPFFLSSSALSSIENSSKSTAQSSPDNQSFHSIFTANVQNGMENPSRNLFEIFAPGFTMSKCGDAEDFQSVKKMESDDSGDKTMLLQRIMMFEESVGNVKIDQKVQAENDYELRKKDRTS